MEEKINKYLLKRLQSLEKDRNQLKDEMSKHGTRINGNGIEENEALGFNADLAKIESEIEKVNVEKNEINGWMDKKDEATSKLEDIPVRRESLLKDQKQCLEAIQSVKSKNYDRNAELLEYESDLEKINSELERVEQEEKNYNAVVTDMENKINEYATKHSISLEKKNTKPEPTVKLEANPVSKPEPTVKPKANPISKPEPTFKPEPNLAINPELTFGPESIYSKQLLIEKEYNKVTIGGKSYSYKELEVKKQYLSRARIKKEKGLEDFEKNMEFLINSDADMDIVAAMMLRAEEKQSNLKDDREAIDKITQETIQSISDYANLIRNPENKDNYNIQITYNAKRKIKDIFKDRNEFNKFKEQAYEARKYTKLVAGPLTKFQFKLKEIRENRWYDEIDSADVNLLNDGSETVNEESAKTFRQKLQEKAEKVDIMSNTKRAIAKAKSAGAKVYTGAKNKVNNIQTKIEQARGEKESLLERFLLQPKDKGANNSIDKGERE